MAISFYINVILVTWGQVLKVTVISNIFTIGCSANDISVSSLLMLIIL